MEACSCPQACIIPRHLAAERKSCFLLYRKSIDIGSDCRAQTGISLTSSVNKGNSSCRHWRLYLVNTILHQFFFDERSRPDFFSSDFRMSVYFPSFLLFQALSFQRPAKCVPFFHLEKNLHSYYHIFLTKSIVFVLFDRLSDDIFVNQDTNSSFV